MPIPSPCSPIGVSERGVDLGYKLAVRQDNQRRCNRSGQVLATLPLSFGELHSF